MLSLFYEVFSIYNSNAVHPQFSPLSQFNHRHKNHQNRLNQNLPNKLELTRFGPYHFASIAEVVDLHLGQLMYFLHRAVFTEEEYKMRNIKVNFATFWRCLLHGALNWSTVVFLLLISFCSLSPSSSPSSSSIPNFLSGFTSILEEALQMSSGHQIALFSFVLAATFTLQDDAALYSLYLSLTYQSTKLEVMYELRESLDQTMAPKEKAIIINYFVFFSYLSGLANKVAAFSLVGFTLELLRTGVKLYLVGTIDLFQLITGGAIAAAVQLLFFEMLFDFFTLFTGLFWVVKIFRLKLDQVIEKLGQFRQRKNEPLFESFYSQYLLLHRLILQYNITTKRYIQNLDFASKFLTTFIIIYVIKIRSKVGGIGSENFLFSYLFLAMYLVIYAYDMAMHFRLATFQSKQKVIYKELSSVSGRELALKKLKKIKARPIRFRLKLTGAMEFASGNRFGFTLGRLYLIEPIKVVQSFTMNLYMLILLAEKVQEGI